MRTIAEIKQRIDSGKHKWGRDLFRFILPFIEQDLTMEEISYKLKEHHDIELNMNQLYNLKRYYGKKVIRQFASPADSSSVTSDPSPTDVEQKQEWSGEENPVPAPTKRTKDYRRPSIEPKKSFG